MNDPSTSSDREQALAVFSDATEELHYHKSQQWHVTNYALLAYAALVTTPSFLNSWRILASSIFTGLVIIFMALVILVFIASWHVLSRVRAEIDKNSCRIEKARTHLPLLQQIHVRTPGKPGFLDRCGGGVMVSMRGTVFIGAGIALLINFERILSA